MPFIMPNSFRIENPKQQRIASLPKLSFGDANCLFHFTHFHDGILLNGSMGEHNSFTQFNGNNPRGSLPSIYFCRK
jgi:hypothetical protein